MAEQEVYKPIHVRYRIKSNGRMHHMMYCGYCGQYNQRVYEKDNYCRRCGNRIDWEDEDDKV